MYDFWLRGQIHLELIICSRGAPRDCNVFFLFFFFLGFGGWLLPVPELAIVTCRRVGASSNGRRRAGKGAPHFNQVVDWLDGLDIGVRRSLRWSPKTANIGGCDKSGCSQ